MEDAFGSLKRLARAVYWETASRIATALQRRCEPQKRLQRPICGTSQWLAATSQIAVTGDPRTLGVAWQGRSLRLRPAMEKFVIQGGVPLSGELTVAGNKNAALPILAACLLTEEELLLHRVPRIRDTEAQIAILVKLGVEAEWVGDNSLRLCARTVTSSAADEELSSKIRASFLLAGPLLA